MLKTLKTVIKVIWVVLVLSSGAVIGASVGWIHNGWAGAILLGIVGMGAGAFLAASPISALQLLR